MNFINTTLIIIGVSYSHPFKKDEKAFLFQNLTNTTAYIHIYYFILNYNYDTL